MKGIKIALLFFFFCLTGSRVTAVLLNKWIFPIGQSIEASRWRVCCQRALPRLVFMCAAFWVLGVITQDYMVSSQASHPSETCKLMA